MTTATVDIGSLITRTSGLHGGYPHVCGKGVMVRTIAFRHKKGLTAEEIAVQFGHLSLAEVYAALSYYHANTQEIDEDLAAQAVEAKRLEAYHTGSEA